MSVSKGPKIPGAIKPSTPTRMDDPAALRAREEAEAGQSLKGYQNLIMAPLDNTGPQVSTQMKTLMGM